MRLIDGDELLEKAEYIPTALKSGGNVCWLHGITVATIENAPTIDPESLRPHGKWEDSNFYRDRPLCYDCSNCGLKLMYKPNYCPNCGARMEDDHETNR